MTLRAILMAACFCATELAAADSIRRLDGSKISLQDADAFAKKTLAAAHITGAQIAVPDEVARLFR